MSVFWCFASARWLGTLDYIFLDSSLKVSWNHHLDHQPAEQADPVLWYHRSRNLKIKLHWSYVYIGVLPDKWTRSDIPSADDDPEDVSWSKRSSCDWAEEKDPCQEKNNGGLSEIANNTFFVIKWGKKNLNSHIWILLRYEF